MRNQDKTRNILGLATSTAPHVVGGFLFSKISETPIVHVPKLFPLLHWFQNTFCFLSSSTPSHGDKRISASMGISMGKWPKITFPGSKMVPKVSKWGFQGGYLYWKVVLEF